MSGENDRARAFAKALRALADGASDAAADIADGLLRRWPEDASVHQLMAAVALRRSRPVEAERWAASSLAARPDHYATQVLAASAARALGHWPAALARFRLMPPQHCENLFLLDWVARRQVLAARYDANLAALPLVLPRACADARSAWHLYVIQLKENAAISRAALFAALRADDIGVNVHYIPVHLQPYYRKLGFKPGDFPQAEAYYSRTLSIPMFAAMTEAQQDRVIGRLQAHCG